MIVMEVVQMGLTFGEAVRRRRGELELSQDDLAERLETDATRISKVETGHTFRRIPDAETFNRWAAALETTPAVILAQMGYIEGGAAIDPQRPEMVFTMLADEVRNAALPGEVADVALDGIRHARLLWEAKQG